MCTPEHIARLQEQIDELEAKIPQITSDIIKIWRESKLRTYENPTMTPTENEEKDLSSIHFNFRTATRNHKIQFSQHLTNDLELRKLDVAGSISQRKERLLESYKEEWRYVHASEWVEQFSGTKENSVLVLLMNAVPCILHLENRMGIKILSLCLKNGLTNAKDGKLAWVEESLKTSKHDRPTIFLNHITMLLNRYGVLGTEDQPTQWKIPYDKKTQLVTTICMDNVRIRKVLKNIDKIVDKCIYDRAKNAAWKSSVLEFNLSMDILKKREDLSDDEIWSYQFHADQFFQQWVGLHGSEGITNYAHMIGSGHIREYLKHYKNLSRHAQQGWEAFNSAFKRYFYSRTQRGGASSKGKGQKSRMKSMARWIQRRMIFMDEACTEEKVYNELIGNDPETGTPTMSWVRNHGGTLEYGQFVNEEDKLNEKIIDMDDKWVFEEDYKSRVPDEAEQDLLEGFLEWYESDIEEDDI